MDAGLVIADVSRPAGMRATRVLTLLVSAWVLAFTCGYVVLIRRQDESADVAWWYVVLLVSAALLVFASTFTSRVRRVLAVATVLIALSCLAVLLSIGLGLLPAFAGAVAALARSGQVERPARRIAP